MGRRRRPRQENDEGSLWCHSIDRNLRDGSLTLQMVGLGSPTSTVFARIVPNSSNLNSYGRSLALGEVAGLILSEARTFHSAVEAKSRILLSVEELFGLGSIWILSRGNSELAPRRASSTDAQTIPDDWACVSLRVHYRASRFPSSWSVADSIVHEDKDCGFVVLNKPGGVPAHATVDNGVENALSMFKAGLAAHAKAPPTAAATDDIAEGSIYATLPQRLDTETSGLMMIATKKEFSAYASKLLQQKTVGRTQQQECHGMDLASMPVADITKRYRCIVCMNSLGQLDGLEKLSITKTIVTHYLDSNSPAPKLFLTNPPLDGIVQDSKTKWLECKLIITRAGDAIPVMDKCCKASMSLTKSLWSGEHNEKPKSCHSVVELEVELLTGRTHQIRGQLSSIGCPIVGDPLYGGGGDVCAERMRNSNTMGLQCCAVEFPQPEWTVVTRNHRKNQRRMLVPSKERCAVHLDRAWWTPHVDQYYKTIEDEQRRRTAN